MTKIQITATSSDFMPAYAKHGDAAADLKSTIDYVLFPGERFLVSTGISIALPDNYVGLVHPRSGLAARNGITILNTPGTIDSGYRGEIKVILYNAGDADFVIRRGDRIAQLVIQEFVSADFELVEELPSSERGEGGFGSTGVASV
jgi:dUTP pyrophosphatase